MTLKDLLNKNKKLVYRTISQLISDIDCLFLSYK